MPFYKRCFSCGKYLASSDNNINNINYCSKECKEKYTRCIVCGDYYPIEDEKTILAGFICSDICREKHRLKRKNIEKNFDFTKLQQ